VSHCRASGVRATRPKMGVAKETILTDGFRVAYTWNRCSIVNTIAIKWKRRLRAGLSAGKQVNIFLLLLLPTTL
jgi:hypothetical protein